MLNVDQGLLDEGLVVNMFFVPRQSLFIARCKDLAHLFDLGSDKSETRHNRSFQCRHGGRYVRSEVADDLLDGAETGDDSARCFSLLVNGGKLEIPVSTANRGPQIVKKGIRVRNVITPQP